MASVIPAFIAALQDRTLRGAARDVYIWLHEHLDVVDYRPVKHSGIETDLRISSVAIARSFRQLIRDGYIARGPKAGKIWTYRLVYSRPIRPITLLGSDG
jgi:hypothetical protein